MVEINEDAIKQFLIWAKDNPGRSKIFVFEEYSLVLNVSTEAYTRELTDDVIKKVNDNEELFKTKIQNALLHYGNYEKQALITYYCFVYKILKSRRYRYRTGSGSRDISLKYFCDVFNQSRVTLFARFNSTGEKFAYCRDDLGEYGISKEVDASTPENVKILIPIFKELQEAIGR